MASPNFAFSLVDQFVFEQYRLRRRFFRRGGDGGFGRRCGWGCEFRGRGGVGCGPGLGAGGFGLRARPPPTVGGAVTGGGAPKEAAVGIWRLILGPPEGASAGLFLAPFRRVVCHGGLTFCVTLGRSLRTLLRPTLKRADFPSPSRYRVKPHRKQS